VHDRKVRTASGATAVQSVEKRHGQRRIVEHLGSAHSESELALLVHVAKERIHRMHLHTTTPAPFTGLRGPGA